MLPYVVSRISSFDDMLLVRVIHFRSGRPYLDHYVGRLASLNAIQFLPIVLAICWLWFERTDKRVFNRRLLVEAVLTSIAAMFVARFLAVGLPFRARPFLLPQWPFNVDAGLRTWSSFPSDHATLAFALSASLLRISPKIALWAFFHSVMFICLPRLYLGLHYPSDLIGGALIGTAFVILTTWLPGSDTVTEFLLNAEARHPAGFYVTGFFLLNEIAEMFQDFRTLAVGIFHFLRHVVT